MAKQSRRTNRSNLYRACPKLIFVGHLCRNLCRNVRFFWADSTKTATKAGTKVGKTPVPPPFVATFVGCGQNRTFRQRLRQRYPTKVSLGQALNRSAAEVLPLCREEFIRSFPGPRRAA